MADRPSAPWRLECPWCDFKIVVNARGMRGEDPGSGVQAAQLMERHAKLSHGSTWEQFLNASRRQEVRS